MRHLITMLLSFWLMLFIFSVNSCTIVDPTPDGAEVQFIQDTGGPCG